MSKLSGRLIFKKFRIKKLISTTSFGCVYEGINEKEKESVAMKFEKIKSPNQCLESEAFILFYLKSFGIPRIISYGKNTSYRILVEELLGPSIEKIWKIKNANINYKLKYICMIALQVLDRLEYIHSKNIIHRDIKSSNISIGRKNPEIIYLIDFGLAFKYRSSRTGKHIKFKIIHKAYGSLEFLSINGNKGYLQSRRDDLESLGYTIIFLAKNNLPWINKDIYKIKSYAKRYKTVAKLKSSIGIDKLCQGLPEEIGEYIKYCRRLYFEQNPNYDYLRNLFKCILYKNNQKNDLKFFWNLNEGKKKNIDNRNNFFKRKETSQNRLYRQIKNSLEKARSQDLANNFKFLRLNTSDDKIYSEQKTFNKIFIEEKNKNNDVINNIEIRKDTSLTKKNELTKEIYKKKITGQFEKKRKINDKGIKRINTINLSNINNNSTTLQNHSIDSIIKQNYLTSSNRNHSQFNLFNKKSNYLNIFNFKINNALDNNIFKNKEKEISNNIISKINLSSIKNINLNELISCKQNNTYKTLEQRNKIKIKNKENHLKIIDIKKVNYDKKNKINRIHKINFNDQNINNSNQNLIKKYTNYYTVDKQDNINDVNSRDSNINLTQRISYGGKLIKKYEMSNNILKIYNQKAHKSNNKNKYRKITIYKEDKENPLINNASSYKYYSLNESNYPFYCSNINQNNGFYSNNNNNNIFVIPNNMNFSLNLNGLK